MFINWKNIILYSFYYKYLAFTDNSTLFVWNDCMKTTKQNCLEYNCVRHCAEQTHHHIIFNTLPLRDSKEDFMILYTLSEPNPFIKLKTDDVQKFQNVDFRWFKIPEVKIVRYEANEKQREKYEYIKQKAIDSVKRDPNIIPRRCLKYAESLHPEYDSKAELKSIDMTVSDSGLKVDAWYIKRLMNIIQDIRYVKSKV